MSDSKRGRPRQYDPVAALNRALDVFWSRGYCATTLDDLVTAMGMNRPSIYNAFGDKEQLYRQTLTYFIGQLRETIGRRVMDEADLVRALRNFYTGALAVYFGKEPALGCFVFCTAPAEAAQSPEVRSIMRGLVEELDQMLTRRFREAQQAGLYPVKQDARLAAKLAQGTLHSLALRARAGESRAALVRMANAAAIWHGTG